MHRHGAASQRSTPTDRLDLQAEVLEADGVVLVDGAFELKREDRVQILARAGHEGGSGLRRGHLEAAIELAHIVLGEEAAGRRQGGD